MSTGPNTLVAAGPIAAAAGQGDILYALTGDNALYTVGIGASGATCAANPTVAHGVKALAGDGPLVYALVEDGGHWTVLAVDTQGKTSLKLSLPADAAHTPVALAVRGGDFYAAYNGVEPNSGGIWHFAGKDLSKPAQTITTTPGVASVSVADTGTLFALLADGSLVRLDGAGHVLPVAVSLASPVLSADPSTYVASTPVPTLPTAESAPVNAPTASATPAQVSGSISPSGTATAPAATPATPTVAPQTGSTSALAGPPTLFAGSSTLSADRTAAGRLLVGDGAVPRVVRFDASGSDLRPIQQYVYGPPLSPLQSVTVSADGTRVYAWSGAQLVAVTLPD
ncbi:MAG: hypothetical protein PVSMB4_04060 [Ktedonobacterales bacterium]